MARAPRRSIAKTSGQGTQRAAYQSAYKLGLRGTGQPAGFRNQAKVETGASRRDYHKPAAYPEQDMNISYGDTWSPALVDHLRRK